VLRDDEAYDNGVAGFVIDDGRVADDGNPRHAHAVPSDANLLLRPRSHHNGVVGIVVEGGSRNDVEGMIVDDNRYGVWVKNAASGTRVAAGTITRSQAAGVSLFPGTTGTELSSIKVDDASIGVDLTSATSTTVDGVEVHDASSTALRMTGDHAADTFSGVRVDGEGRRSVEVKGAVEPVLTAAQLDDSGWVATHPPVSPLRYALHHGSLVAWLPIMVLPLLLWLPSRRRRRPLPGQVVVGGAS
jgi:hypothetical protein